MKRFLALAVGLALCGVVSVAGEAKAAATNAQWVVEPIFFRTQANGLNLDSAQVSHAALHADTTVAIAATSLWALPNLPSAVADSSVWATLYFKGRSGASTTQGFDSAYVDIQVSIDGSHWVTLTPTRAFNSGGTTHDGAIYLEQSSADAIGVPIKVVSSATGLSVLLDSATAPSTLKAWGWPFLRFIINNDANGSFVAEVGHWKLF